MQQRSQEARHNWEAALESKDRALSQLEDALVTQKRSLQQQIEQQQSAVSMTHNQILQGNDAQILMQRQLDSSQQQVCSWRQRLTASMTNLLLMSLHRLKLQDSSCSFAAQYLSLTKQQSCTMVHCIYNVNNSLTPLHRKHMTENFELVLQ